MVPRFGGGKILALPCIANQRLVALLEVFTQILNNSVAVGNNANPDERLPEKMCERFLTLPHHRELMGVFFWFYIGG
jgi:hypothetical protein